MNASLLMSDPLRAKGNKSQVHIVSGTDHYFQGATKDQAKEVLDVFFKFLDDSLSKPAKK